MMPERPDLKVIAPPPSGSACLLASQDPALYESLEPLVFPKAGWGRERRATARLPVEVLYEERVGGRRWYRLTRDLSTFGLCAQEGPRYPGGTQVTLTLHLPDELTGPVSFKAEVLGTNEATGGVRMAFRSPPAVSARRLHHFLFGQGHGTASRFARRAPLCHA